MRKRGKRRIEGSAVLGQRLKQLRVERGLTQLELARLVDVSPTHLSAIETGKVTNPGIELVHRISEVLGTSVRIGTESTPIKSPSTLAYESPLSIGTRERVLGESWEAIRGIDAALNDKRLTDVQRADIAEKIASYATWLRDRLLKQTSKNDRPKR